MTDELYRLVYYSKNRIDQARQGPELEISAILAASRRNNGSAGVTGALLFNAGCFGQVLEGGRRALEATFERIQCDARHGDVSLLAFAPIADRGFPNWSMAFVGSAQACSEQFAMIGAESGFDPSLMSGDELYDALQRVTREEEAGPVAE